MALNGTIPVDDFADGRSRRAPIGTYTLRIISDALGNVDDTGGARTLGMHINGELHYITIIPGTGGEQPTNLWDLTMWDPEGNQIFTDTGLSNTANTVKVPETDATTHRVLPTNGKLKLQAAGMGNAKAATIKILIR